MRKRRNLTCIAHLYGIVSHLQVHSFAVPLTPLLHAPVYLLFLCLGVIQLNAFKLPATELTRVANTSLNLPTTTPDEGASTPTDLAGLINGTLSDDLGDNDNRVLVPNDITHSVLLSRINGSASRMPPLASSELDPIAIQLVADWITTELPTRQSYSQWANAQLAGTSDDEPEDDADFDGQTNYLEYLAGTDPQDSASRFLFTFGNTTLSFPYTANRSTLIEASTDLTNWTIFPDSANSNAAPANSGTRLLTLPSDEPKLFFRAILTQP